MHNSNVITAINVRVRSTGETRANTLAQFAELSQAELSLIVQHLRQKSKLLQHSHKLAVLQTRTNDAGRILQDWNRNYNKLLDCTILLGSYRGAEFQ